MLNIIEKILFEKFSEMPPFIRVLTYLVMLVLFIYLLLAPNFIDGHLKIKDPNTSRLIDYRGAELRMHIEGRTYKFTADEHGYWSIPVVSKLPKGFEFDVHDIDNDIWHKVKLSFFHIWLNKTCELEINNDPPTIYMVYNRDNDKLYSRLFYGFIQYIPIKSKQALAAELMNPVQLPLSLSEIEKARIKNSILLKISEITGKQLNEINQYFPLTGKKSPTYIQKIKLIQELEQEFSLVIPDEHWKYMENAGQLIDYLQKRQILFKNKPNSYRKEDWPAIQRSFPPNRRPIFKR